MKIEHLGVWVLNLELMRSFYLKYFDTSSGENMLIRKQSSSLILFYSEMVKQDWS
jgi:lactoylglutathione lyase